MRVCESYPQYELDSHPNNMGIRCECGRWRIPDYGHEYGPVWECPKEKEIREKGKYYGSYK